MYDVVAGTVVTVHFPGYVRQQATFHCRPHSSHHTNTTMGYCSLPPHADAPKDQQYTVLAVRQDRRLC